MIEPDGEWRWPSAAKKAHWFPVDADHSACGGWWFSMSRSQFVTRNFGTGPGPHDPFCNACHRAVRKTMEVPR